MAKRVLVLKFFNLYLINYYYISTIYFNTVSISSEIIHDFPKNIYKFICAKMLDN